MLAFCSPFAIAKSKKEKKVLVNEKYDKELDVYISDIQYSRRKSMNDRLSID